MVVFEEKKSSSSKEDREYLTDDLIPIDKVNDNYRKLGILQFQIGNNLELEKYKIINGLEELKL